jgi:HSP20 family protein
MNTLVRFDPFRGLQTLKDRMDRILEGTAPCSLGGDDVFRGAWAPAVDIYEGDGELVVEAELPGLEKGDIKVNVEDGVLTLKGERKLSKETKEENYHRVERAYGAFTRSFTLPDTVDAEKISAKHKDGVLRVSLPKKPEAKPKVVDVKVA